MIGSSSPSKRERLFAQVFQKKALLLTLLLHLFVFIVAPTYDCRTIQFVPKERVQIEWTNIDKDFIMDSDPWWDGLEDATAAKMDPEHPPHEEDTLSTSSMPKHGEYVFYEQGPVLVRSVTPIYPVMLRMAGIQDQIGAHLLVGTDGTVKNIMFMSGYEAFHDAVREAVVQMLFQPAMVRNQAVAVWVSMSFSFTLRDGGHCVVGLVGGLLPPVQI